MVKPQKTDKTASPVKMKSNRCSRPSAQKCRCEPTDLHMPSMSSLCKSCRTRGRSLTRQCLSNEPRTKTQEKAHERRRCSQENASGACTRAQENAHERRTSSQENANGRRRCCQDNTNERRRCCPHIAPETRTRAREDVYDASKRSQENEYERHPSEQRHPVKQHTRAQENAYDKSSSVQKHPYEPRTKGVENQYEQSTREQDTAKDTRARSQENVYESRTSAQEDEDEKLTRVQELVYDPSIRTQESTYEPRSTANGNAYEPCIELVEKASFYLALLDELNSETFSAESSSYAAQSNGQQDPMDPSSASAEIIEAFNELSRILRKGKSTPKRKCTCDSKKATEETFSRKSGEKQRRASGSIESREGTFSRNSGEKQRRATGSIESTEETFSRNSGEKQRRATGSIESTEETFSRNSGEKQRRATGSIESTEETFLRNSGEKQRRASGSIQSTKETFSRNSGEKQRRASGSIESTEGTFSRNSGEKQRRATGSIESTEETFSRKSGEKQRRATGSIESTEETFSRKSGEKQRRATGSIESFVNSIDSPNAVNLVPSASSYDQDIKNSSTQTLTSVNAYRAEIESNPEQQIPVIIIQDGSLEFKLQDLSNSGTESLSDRKKRKLNVSLTCEEFMTLMGVMRREINRAAEKCRWSKDKSKVRNCTCSNQKSSQVKSKIEKQWLDNSNSPALSELSIEDQEQQTMGSKTTVILEPRQKPNGMLQAESSHSVVDLLGQLKYTDKPAPMEQKVAHLTERRRTPCRVDVQDFCKPHNQRKAPALRNVMTERNTAQEDAGKIVDFCELLARLTQHKVYERRPLPASLRPSRSRSCEKRQFFADPAMLAAKRSELCWARYMAETSPCSKLHDAALKARQASDAQRYKLFNVTEQVQRPADRRNKLFNVIEQNIAPRRANHQNVNNMLYMTEQRYRPGNCKPVLYQDSYNSVNGVPPMQMTAMFHTQNSMTYAQLSSNGVLHF